MNRTDLWALTFLLAISSAPVAVAESTDAGPLTQSSSVPQPKKLSTSKNSKGNLAREKKAAVRETEGTKAQNRFETDTVIKSIYELNGEPLEVDPD